MMKKYNKPEIVALALETVDVIETSGHLDGEALGQTLQVNNVKVIADDINNMTNTWSW